MKKLQKMKFKLQDLSGKIGSSYMRYPLVITMAVIAATTATIAVGSSNQEVSYILTKLLLCTTLGISLFFGIGLISFWRKRTWDLELLGLLILSFLYFYVLPKNRYDFTEMHVLFLIPMYLASHLFVSLAAFPPKETGIRFWEFNKKMFINFALTLVFTGLLTGGILLAILAVDNLFSLHIDSEIYPKVFLFLLISGSCSIFLLFENHPEEVLKNPESYPKFLNAFVQFVLIPLILVYGIILYFYGGKILLQWELPRGWVSNLVLAYAVVGILASLLICPLKELESKTWVKFFNISFYLSLLPLLILLFVAILKRISDYGFTEPRYYVLISGFWLMMVAIYCLLRRENYIKFIPFSLVLSVLFVLIFPYLNALSVSKRSQENKFVSLLQENKLLKNGKINFNQLVSSEVADQVGATSAYLISRNEEAFIYKKLDEKDQKKLHQNSLYKKGFAEEEAIYGLFTNIKNQEKENSSEVSVLSGKTEFQNIEGYQYFVMLDDQSGVQTLKINQDQITINLSHQDAENQFVLELNNVEKLDLSAQINALFSKNTSKQAVDPLSVEGDVGKYHVKINFNLLSTSHLNTEKPTINTDRYVVFLKERN